VLTLSVPKREDAKAKQIKVSVGMPTMAAATGPVEVTGTDDKVDRATLPSQLDTSIARFSTSWLLLGYDVGLRCDLLRRPSHFRPDTDEPEVRSEMGKKKLSWI
jgi:hypothetical protein